MNISKAAKATGLTPKTIRYYESMELITPAKRQDNGYRNYSDSHLREMSFIKHARELGFTLEECGELLGLYKDNSRKSASVKALALKKIADIETRIAQLQTIKTSLNTMTECCSGNDAPDCPILDKLAGK